jgi:hypothetical protein
LALGAWRLALGAWRDARTRAHLRIGGREEYIQPL